MVESKDTAPARVMHSPGPWRWDHNKAALFAGDMELVYSSAEVDDDSVELANGTLMAAAPNLLAALEKAFDWMGTCSLATEQETYDAIQAAIAKARGVTP